MCVCLRSRLRPASLAWFASAVELPFALFNLFSSTMFSQVLVSFFCCNKGPYIRCLKRTDTYCLTVLNARSPKSSCSQGLVFSQAFEGESAQSLSPTSGQPHSYLALQIRHVTSVLCLHMSSPVCLSFRWASIAILS